MQGILTPYEALDPDGEWRFIIDPSQVSPIEYFSGPLKQKIREFIVYCHMGGFAIW